MRHIWFCSGNKREQCMSKHIISCCTCTYYLFFLHAHFALAVPALRCTFPDGFTTGSSLRSVTWMWNANQEQKYIVHILTLITAPVGLTQHFFTLTHPCFLFLTHSIPTVSVLHESTEKPASTIPPGQRLVTADCLYQTLLFCMTIIPQLPAL